MAEQPIYHAVIHQDAEFASVDLSGDLDMANNNIENIGKLLFNLANLIIPAEGEVNWNAEDGTLQVGLPGGEAVLQLGQEQQFRVKNDSGAQLVNGTILKISGATGGRAKVDKATTTPQSTSGAIAMITETVEDNQIGYMTTFGEVRGLDTSAFGAGDRMFLSDTAGEFTNVLPAATSRKVFIGICTRSHATEGKILLSPINIFFLSELSGVVFTNLQVGDVITWDGTTWINQAP
jgi:hypothetical protein